MFFLLRLWLHLCVLRRRAAFPCASSPYVRERLSLSPLFSRALRSKTPVVPPRSPRTRVATRHRVAEVRELESYAEAAKDANWRATMEEEMHALAEKET